MKEVSRIEMCETTFGIIYGKVKLHSYASETINLWINISLDGSIRAGELLSSREMDFRNRIGNSIVV